MIQHKNRGSKIKTTIIVVLSAVLIVAGLDLYQKNQKIGFLSFDPKLSFGNPKAELHIMEFVDFACVQCAIGSLYIKDYIAKHPERVYLSLHYQPLGELNSTISAVYAQCAAQQNKFWDMADLLFAKQFEWKTLLKIKPELNKIAQEAKLNLDDLSKCVDDPKTEEIVKKDKRLGESRFIESTPSYFVNGQLHVGVGALRKALDAYFKDDIK